MNAVITGEIDMAAISEQPPSAVIDRARLYHFLELALAHPGEDGHDFFRKESTETEFLRLFSDLLQPADDLSAKGIPAAGRFFASLRQMSYEDVEASHISLFTNNYPHLPCPPYGSLFTASDSEKRLEEMSAIKAFYQRCGVDISDTYDDLPDHLCVELEFVQLLCFREDEALRAGDAGLLSGVRATEVEFLDRYLLPFASRLAAIAGESASSNPYSALLEATHCLLLQHRRSLGAPDDLPVPDQENRP